MESETITKKKLAPVWAIIVLIIIAAIVFLVFRSTNQADAPTIDDAIDTIATSTATIETPTSTAAVPTPSDFAPTPAKAPAADDGTRVIQGDGYIATIRPVSETGVAPTIQEFTMRQGETCIFTWDTSNAVSCDIINTSNQTGVKGVPAEGSLQTGDPGVYKLSCKGSGGKVTSSETIECK